MHVIKPAFSQVFISVLHLVHIINSVYGCAVCKTVESLLALRVCTYPVSVLRFCPSPKSFCDCLNSASLLYTCVLRHCWVTVESEHVRGVRYVLVRSFDGRPVLLMGTRIGCLELLVSETCRVAFLQSFVLRLYRWGHKPEKKSKFLPEGPLYRFDSENDLQNVYSRRQRRPRGQ